ncbi:MAG: hypothetical protein L3J96_00840 [Thermoplasmata archaeon]|nr:hypothetical protein [Thermoplasmata archaeon]
MPENNWRDSVQSRDREMMLEHLFLSRLLRESWSRRQTTIEVLRPDVDSSGYDLVLEQGRIVRHVQLKASRAGSQPGYLDLNIGLTGKPAGCAIFMIFEEGDPEQKLNLRYFFLGGGPREPLDLSRYPIARRTTANRQGVRPLRQNTRRVPRREFRELPEIGAVYDALFGRPPRPGETRTTPYEPDSPE